MTQIATSGLYVLQSSGQKRYASQANRMQIIQFLANMATLVAACVAVYGIHKWRAEHRGAKQIDLAEETLASFYNAQDALAYVRNIAGFSSETEGVVRGEHESEKDYNARKNAAVVFKRFQDQHEVFSKLHALRYRFMATFGKSAAKPFDELNEIVWDVKRAAMRLGRLWARDYFATEEQANKHQEELQQYESIFWAGFDPDPLLPRINACVSTMESTCRAIIEHGLHFDTQRKGA